MRTIYVLGLLYLAMSVAYLGGAGGPAVTYPDPASRVVHPTDARPDDAVAWFHSVKASCNPVEIETRIRWSPPPPSSDGIAYAAACSALAGRIDEARGRILELPADLRWHAAGIVFNVGHPVADAGNDLAAGPLMELVVEFWPNHYMALYHAGAARFALQDYGAAHGYLSRFLENYEPDDGWRRSALRMIEQVEAR